MQDEFRDNGRAFRVSRRTPSRHRTAPDDDMELAKGVPGLLREPRDAHGAARGLQHATVRRTVLLDRALQLFDPPQHAFRGQFIEQRRN